MIDFLEDLGIKRDTILKLNKIYEINQLYDLSCNKEECSKIIEYFRTIGIIEVDKLIEYRLDLFYKTLSQVEKLFQKLGESTIVTLINEDYTNIELLFR